MGVLVGMAAAGLIARGASRERAATDRQRLAALPLACDVIAACVVAGAPPVTALRAAAGVVGDPLGGELGSVARTLRLGEDPARAWSEFVTAAPGLRALAATLSRATESGASPASLLDALALDSRERQRLAGEAAARRAGVAMVAPLGACFLPAFVLLGVVPLVAGLLRGGLGPLTG